MILGIDTSTSCGWALLLNNGRRVQSGMWDLQPSKVHGAGVRFTRLHDYLDGLYRAWPRITHVAYEIPVRARTRDVALALFGITTHVESWAERNDLEYEGLMPKTVKAAAGLGERAEKGEMIAAAERVWSPYSFASSDEADACFVALAFIDAQLQAQQSETRANG
jgi:Holliday junction resolvasome RuvABC endonuclease subunit